MPGVEVVDPIGYSGVWTFVGITVIVAVVAWFVLLFWFMRDRDGGAEAEQPTTRPRTAPSAASTDPFAPVRLIYLDKLEEIKARHEREELDARAVHLEIRRVLRDYTKARTGIDAATFTASDAARVGLTGPLATSLRRLAYPSFAARSVARPERSLFRAGQVIKQW